jgi:hypothetical protein
VPQKNRRSVNIVIIVDLAGDLGHVAAGDGVMDPVT